MKLFLPKLKVGQRVKAMVSEVTDSGDLIASFRGDLLRVNNKTHRQFVVGETVDLEILMIEPLKFQLVKKSTVSCSLNVIA